MCLKVNVQKNNTFTREICHKIYIFHTLGEFELGQHFCAKVYILRKYARNAAKKASS